MEKYIMSLSGVAYFAVFFLVLALPLALASATCGFLRLPRWSWIAIALCAGACVLVGIGLFHVAAAKSAAV
jgi:hypothetical protein